MQLTAIICGFFGTGAKAELYAGPLAANRPMLAAIGEAIGQGMPVLNYKTFKALLGRSKYSEDGPVDVAEVAKLLSNG